MDKEENLHLNDLFTGSVMEKVDKTIKYIQKNAGAISLIFTVAITLGSVLIKFMYYLSDLGYSYYFGTSKESIDVSSENIIYSFFADGVMALFAVMLNFISYAISKSGMKRLKKVVYLLLLIIETATVLILIDFLRGIRYDIYDIILVIIASTVFFSLGIFFFWIFKKDTEKDKKKLNKKTKEEKINKRTNVSLFKKITIFVAFVVVCIVAESFLIMFMGLTNATGLSEFKLLESLSDDTVYAVVYETSDSFIITECEINDEKQTIYFSDLATKKEIDKTGVEYSVRKLTQVKD